VIDATVYHWSFDPLALTAVATLGGVYASRYRTVHDAPGRRPTTRDRLRALSFAAGLLALLAAFVSPVERLGEERLFTAHMVQHLLILDIAPILLLLGLSRSIMRPATRRLQPIERSLGLVAHPATALVALIGVIWLWHLPAMYELALDHPFAHGLEHLSFFCAGLAFWWFIIEPVPPRHPLRGMATLGYVAGAKLLLGALGVVLAFSPNVLYDNYERAPRTWGLSPLEDLNVGGLLMMLEQSLVLILFFAIVFARMLNESEKEQQRRERFGVSR
jgi:cytochrome c oxidase assembly factor CtaG